jgi:hypothetical protein
MLKRAAARGEAPSAAARLRVATTPKMLLRAEYAMHSTPSAPDDILVEIVDDVLPLVYGHG